MKKKIIYFCCLLAGLSGSAYAQDSLSVRTVPNGFTDEDVLTTTQSVSVIRADEIKLSNSNDIFQALYGTLPGLTVLQQVGWSADPKLFIHGGATLSGKSPLLLVDGYPRSINDLSTEEIESVSVLKDGAATALYGSKGANGVILVTTKRGSYKSMEVGLDYKFGMGILHDMPEFVDAATYAAATNEALLNDGLAPKWSDAEIQAFREGSHPDLYPDVNWMDEGLRDFTTNHQLGLTFKGGGKNLRFFTHIDYQNDMGPLAHARDNDKYSTQMRKNKLSARVNLNVDLTKTTEMILNLHGLLRENHRPSGKMDKISNLYHIPANSFPVKTLDGLWGSNDFFARNPVAEIADVGYANNYRRQLNADLRLIQDFSMLTEGLRAELAVAWDNFADFQEGNTKTYLYQVNRPVMDPVTGEITMVNTRNGGEETALGFWSDLSAQRMRATFDARVVYDRTFSRHGVDATLDYKMESSIPKGRNTIRHYQSIMLYGGYNYDQRYFIDFVANYYGSSLPSKGHKFTLYPAVSAAWVISNESFMKDSGLDLFKLRASWGRSGFADFGYELDKEYYVDGNRYFFGEANVGNNGVMEGRLPMKSVINEMSEKFNIGIDLSALNLLDFTVDLWHDDRSNILLGTNSIYSNVLGITPASECTGKVAASGVDTRLMLNDKIGDFSYRIGGTFSFARSRIIENNEGVLQEPYLTRKGTSVGQFFGLESDGLFESQEEIDIAPRHSFSTVKPGDIRYKDQNGDNIIDQKDMIALGHSTLLPEINYGIQFGLEWKGLGFNLQFQGTGRYSKILNANGIYRPMSNNENLSKWYMEENVRWTPETKETANLPRLSTLANPNNAQDSDFWLRDASYFTLRNAYLYYNLPQKWCKKMKMTGFQIYLRGDNLFRADHIKYANPDHIGAYYPEQAMVSMGLDIRF